MDILLFVHAFLNNLILYWKLAAGRCKQKIACSFLGYKLGKGRIFSDICNGWLCFILILWFEQLYSQQSFNNLGQGNRYDRNSPKMLFILRNMIERKLNIVT